VLMIRNGPGLTARKCDRPAIRASFIAEVQPGRAGTFTIGASGVSQ